MARKKLYQSGNEKLLAHVKRSGGRRATFVLGSKANESLEMLCRKYEMNATQVVNACLVHCAGEAKRLKPEK